MSPLLGLTTLEGNRVRVRSSDALGEDSPALPEADLRRLSRSLKTIFSHFSDGGTRTERVSTNPHAVSIPHSQGTDPLLGQSPRVLLARVLRTAEDPRLTATHRVAVSDALYGLLEQVTVLPSKALRDECLGVATLTATLAVYLNRAGEAQAKPLRKVLRITGDILSKDVGSKVNELVIENSLCSCLALLSVHEDTSGVKAAMNILDMFLKKHIIDLEHLLDIASGYWPIDKARHRIQLPPKPSDTDKRISQLVTQLMQWLHDTDTAPAAGRVVITVFDLLQGSAHSTKSSLTTSPTLWMVPILDAVHKDPSLIDHLEHHLLPGLLRLRHASTYEVLQDLSVHQVKARRTGNMSAEDIRLCLVVMSGMEDLGSALRLGEMSADSGGGSELSYSQQISSTLLVHASTSVRLSALRLFNHTSSAAESFPNNALCALRETLPFFHVESDSKARNDFISIVKKLFLRLRGAIQRLINDYHKLRDVFLEPEPGSQLSPTGCLVSLQDHVNFVSWYTAFLVKELRPTSSYQQHISSLRVLQMLSDSGLCNHIQASLSRSPSLASEVRYQDVFSMTDVSYLFLSLVVDPFDDVRDAATSLLRKFSSTNLAVPIRSYSIEPDPKMDIYEMPRAVCSGLALALQRAETHIRRTGRADHADGVGRLYDLTYASSNGNYHCGESQDREGILAKLLSELEIYVAIAIQDFKKAVTSAPVHGHLIALRYLINRSDFYDSFAKSGEAGQQQWKHFHDRLIHCCTDIWHAVKPVLCYDSPEGHMFVELDEEVNDMGIKDVLSFSWRALKEASSLMHVMASNIEYGPPGVEGGLNYEDFQTLGRLSFSQLAELRHRGAFSTVSQTFAAYCIRCVGSRNSTISDLPKFWYKEALLCIQEKAAALTRRSAGLPTMITGILAAYPHGDFFGQVIADLQSVAKTVAMISHDGAEMSLPQVHALNCLKDVFTNTRLGPATEPYLTDTLVIAMNSLENNVWAIRNCGLMLLKALLTRLTGGAGSNATMTRSSKLTYERYPVLADLVLHLLQQSCVRVEEWRQEPTDTVLFTASRPVQILFPVMEIIERMSLPVKHKISIKELLLYQLHSPSWNIREKVARTLSCLVDEQDMLNRISQFGEARGPTQNTLHGYLLCLRCIVHGEQQDSQADYVYYETLFLLLMDVYDRIVLFNPCPITTAIYLDIISHVVETYLTMISKDSDHASTSFVNAKDIERTLLKPHIVSTNVKIKAKWSQVHKTLRSQNNIGHTLTLDTLLAALARVSILFGSLQDMIGTAQPLLPGIVHDVCDSGSTALRAGIKCLDTVLGLLDIPRLPVLQIYLDLMTNTSETEIRALVMESLTLYLYSKGQLLKALELKQMLETTLYGKHLAEAVYLDQYACLTNPTVYYSALGVKGAMLAYAYTSESSDTIEVRRELHTWTRMLQYSTDEISDLSTRLAAVNSIEDFKFALRPHSSEACKDPHLLGVYIAIYHALIDDDEDIRDKAAAIISWIMSPPTPINDPDTAGNVSLSPAAAIPRMLDFLVKQYNNSELLFKEALSRLTRIGLEDIDSYDSTEAIAEAPQRFPLHLPPVKDLLETAMKEDTSLFVEEKKNLYIDPVQEAERWARVLRGLSLSVNILPLAFVLEAWVVDGLKCLIDVATHELDGPLGWTNKPEVFTLGIQVLSAAQVVLDWGKKGLLHKVDQVRLLLVKFKRIQVHPLWFREATDIE